MNASAVCCLMVQYADNCVAQISVGSIYTPTIATFRPALLRAQTQTRTPADNRITTALY